MQKNYIIKPILIFMLLLPISLFAKDLQKQDLPIAFKNVSIIDGNGGKPIANGTLIVKDGIIVAVGSNRAVKIPKNAQVYDLKGKTVIPAFIAAHSHLGLTKGTTTSDSNNTKENVLRQLRQYAQFGIGAVTSLGRDQESAIMCK